MDVMRSDEGGWIILHANKVIDQIFQSESEAWSWADEFIDDQVFDGPNDFSPPLVYRSVPSPFTPDRR